MLKDKPWRFKDVVPIDKASRSEKSLNFFYLYYRDKTAGKRKLKENLKEISNYLTEQVKDIFTKSKSAGGQ